jgi:hypothetical protein
MNKHFFFKIAFVSLVLLWAGCENKKYNINTRDIDLGVQLAPNGVELFLGYFETKTLEEMLSGIEELYTDAEGNYYMKYEATEQIHWDGGVEIGDIPPIDLSPITDFVGEGIELNLTPPTIALEVENPLTDPLSAQMILTTKKKDGTVIMSLTADVTLLPSTDGVTPRKTYLFIANEDVPFPGDGKTYTRVVPAGYDQILKTLPTTIEVEFETNLPTTPFDFELGYDVELPLVLKRGMVMPVETTETGLNSTFADLADYGVKAAQIGAAVEIDTSFPIRIGGTGDKAPVIEFLDKDGGEIEGLKTTISGVVTGPGDNETGVKTSRLSIVISVPDGGDFAALRQIDQLHLRLYVDASRAESHFNVSQTIGGRIYISLPEGVSLDLADIK